MEKLYHRFGYFVHFVLGFHANFSLNYNGQWHYLKVVGYVQTNGTCHKQIVMFASYGTICAIRLLLVSKVFVKAARVTFNIQMLTHHFHKV